MRDRTWLRCYGAYGVDGLREYSRAAHRHHNQTAEQFEQTILELRQAHMPWGPRLAARRAQASLAGGQHHRKRPGLVPAREKRWRTVPYGDPVAHVQEANCVWCADLGGSVLPIGYASSR